MDSMHSVDAGPDYMCCTAGAPKLCGADIELGNFILGLERTQGTSYEASRALLREIDGVSDTARYQAVCNCPTCRSRYGGSQVAPTSYSKFQGELYSGGGGYSKSTGYDPQDWGRKFLTGNGGCIYIDLDHLELCLPEIISAYDHVACWHAMLSVARSALTAANQKLPDGQRIQVLVNNSDGQGHSYGSHLNFLVTRKLWEDIFHRKLHPMLVLAAYQASSVIFTGQGKVGSENGAPPVAYQLSQRADFMETLVGMQTTFERPIVNSRDEALCGGASLSQGSEKRPQQFGRLHVIFFDNTLCHVSCLLKVGVMQILLCMLEAGKAETRLALDDPVEAVAKYSHDPTLKVRARLACGSHVTAVELQSLFLTEAKPFVESGFCDETVPRAREILALWEDTLTKLAHNDLQALIPRLDWVLKLSILDRAVEQRSGLDYASPELKHLDHLYSSLSLEEGLYWAYERAGVLEKVACDDEINRFLHHPPEDTRAWTRAMLLRAAGTDRIDAVDWDSIRIRKPRMGIWSPKRTVELANPLAFSKGDTATLFEGAQTLDEILDRFETSRGGTIVVSDAPLIPSIPAINFVGGGNGYAAPPPQRIAPGRTSEQDDDPKTTKA